MNAAVLACGAHLVGSLWPWVAVIAAALALASVHGARGRCQSTHPLPPAGPPTTSHVRVIRPCPPPYDVERDEADQ